LLNFVQRWIKTCIILNIINCLYNLWLWPLLFGDEKFEKMRPHLKNKCDLAREMCSRAFFPCVLRYSAWQKYDLEVKFKLRFRFQKCAAGHIFYVYCVIRHILYKDCTVILRGIYFSESSVTLIINSWRKL